MPSSRKRIFSERLADLQSEPVAPNPYRTLGIDPGTAGDLLTEDPSGDALRALAGAVRRILSRRYHPDVPGSGDKTRFEALTEAGTRIDGASAAALRRWASAEQARASEPLSRLRTAHDVVTSRAGDILRANMEHGRNPHHFTHMTQSQGLLLQRGANMLLMRQYEASGVQVRPGRPLELVAGVEPHTTAADFWKFMKNNHVFGLEPATEINTYINENGIASIVTGELEFMMDITVALARYRKMNRSMVRFDASEHAPVAHVWSDLSAPVLLKSTVPTRGSLSPVESAVFQGDAPGGKRQSYRRTIWDLPMEVAGSFNSANFFRQQKHRGIGTAALEGSGTQQSPNYFTMATIAPTDVITADAGYSPLLTPGNFLMLYSAQHSTPVMTDAKVIGMLGTNAGAY